MSSQCIVYQPCMNGGLCTDTANGGFLCTCTADYQGPLCADGKNKKKIKVLTSKETF